MRARLRGGDRGHAVAARCGGAPSPAENEVPGTGARAAGPGPADATEDRAALTVRHHVQRAAPEAGARCGPEGPTTRLWTRLRGARDTPWAGPRGVRDTPEAARARLCSAPEAGTPVGRGLIREGHTGSHRVAPG
ncbi:galectin [Streptomyces azureus]|uniref:Galectin n=1 Tax=Streptomyces azureus TaxID=146537 RepID=A0A0K8PDE0_STRAJ|nr:galectin [Streptomyces azureus]